MSFSPAISLALGFLLAAVVGLVAQRRGALRPGGVLGATLVGGFVFGLGGPTWAGVLIAFFLSSTLLSFFRREHKSALLATAAKDGRRDFRQTLANGGLAALLAILAGIVTRQSPWYPSLALAYLGAISAATADTWATELGVLSPQPPRLLTTGQPVPAGRSGAVSRYGLAASLGGGLFLGLSAFVLIQLASLLTTGEWFLQDWFVIPLCAVAGLTGSLFDSLLGATLQHQRYCPRCHALTERSIHTCGTGTVYRRGILWLDNDLVNLLGTVAGALTGALAGLLVM
ncbi:MAG: DUF92 domain-containing protein [Caldilineae bacterium]|nr:MAG: DUF92 domain-containing protein [Caldilineae bacterium]